MKPFSKTANKWILSTMMIAALGSQYYFSVSSNTSGKFELSSTAAEELVEKIKQLKNTPEITPEEIEKNTKRLQLEYAKKIEAEMQGKPPAKEVEHVAASKDAAAVKKTEAPAAAQVKNPETETEGHSFQVYCEPCAGENKWIVLSNTNLENATKIALALDPKKNKGNADAAATAKAGAEELKKETVAETAKERREREKEEREEKKRLAKEKKEEAKQAKEDKAREAKEERNDAFTEKAEEIADRCQDDLSCKVNRFTALMRNYSGTKKVDQFVVSKAYNSLIDKDLKAGLRGEDGSAGKTAALEALESIMGGDIPADYKAMKTRAVDSAKLAQVSQANAINGLYKQADVYKSQNKHAEEAQTRGQAVVQDQTFRRDSELIYHSMYEGASSAKDQTTLDYVVNTYAPDMRAVLARLGGAGILVDSVSTTSTGNRGGRTGNSTGMNINNGSATNSSNNGLSSVKFGPAGTNRTGNRTGVDLK